jgi:TolB protein
MPVHILTNDTDAEEDYPLTISWIETPAHGAAAVVAGEISYTPATNWSGTETLSYEVSDTNGNTSYGSVTITVTSTNTPPVAIDDTATTLQNTAVMIPVLANDTDADDDTLTIIQVVDAPSHGSVDMVDGEIQYTPAHNWSGIDTFTYSISDGRDTGIATVTITVTPTLTAKDDYVTMLKNSLAVTINVLANDSDPESDPISISEIGTASHGTASLEDGIVTYVPDADFVGTDEFTYTIEDDQNETAIAIVHIKINGITSRVSVATNFVEGNKSSWGSAISGNGQYVAFISDATNLVDENNDGVYDDDKNNVSDIFLYERDNANVIRVSCVDGITGVEANEESWGAALTSDGSLIAFTSLATNLTSQTVTTGMSNIFTRNWTTHETKLITHAYSGCPTGSQANGNSWGASISADGHYITFLSDATNLIPNDTNGTTDVFIYDTTNNSITRVYENVTDQVISADGYHIAFVTTNSLAAEDTNTCKDVYCYDWTSDITSGTLSLMSINNGNTTVGNGNSYKPSISADGRKITFISEATNLVGGTDDNQAVDVFLRNRPATGTATTVLVSATSTGSAGNKQSWEAKISSDGLKVAFTSDATDLITTDTNESCDVMLRDIDAGSTVVVSVSDGETQGNDDSYDLAISSDGGEVVFASLATNLVDDDENNLKDIFVREIVEAQ